MGREGGGLRRGAGSAESQDQGEDASSPGAGRPALASRGRGGDAAQPRIHLAEEGFTGGGQGQ